MMPPASRPSANTENRPRPRRRLLVLVFLGLIIGLALVGKAQTDTSPKSPADTTQAIADTTASHRVLAYYFYTTQRCASCRKIEAYTAEAVTSGFADELKDGKLVFQAVNIEKEGNEHFVKDYQLFTKSVVLVEERSGRQVAWKNLPKVWELLGDKDGFIRYIQGETRGYLSGKQS